MRTLVGVERRTLWMLVVPAVTSVSHFWVGALHAGLGQPFPISGVERVMVGLLQVAGALAALGYASITGERRGPAILYLVWIVPLAVCGTITMFHSDLVDAGGVTWLEIVSSSYLYGVLISPVLALLLGAESLRPRGHVLTL